MTFNGDGSLGAVNVDPVAAGAAAGSVQATWAALPVPIRARSPSTSAPWARPTAWVSSRAPPTSCVTQNGAEVGELNGVAIDEEGYGSRFPANGEQRRLYLPIATFASPGALEAHSGNVAQTDASGEFNLRAAGSGGGHRDAVGPRGREHRSRRRVHPNDRDAARLFRQRPCHHNSR